MTAGGEKLAAVARAELAAELRLSDEIEAAFERYAEEQTRLTLERLAVMAKFPASTLTTEECAEIMRLSVARQIETRRRCGVPEE